MRYVLFVRFLMLIMIPLVLAVVVLRVKRTVWLTDGGVSPHTLYCFGCHFYFESITYMYIESFPFHEYYEISM